MRKLAAICFSLILLSGCANGNKVSPLSPELNQRINNAEGKIDDIKNNQNGLMIELGKLRQDSQIHARDIENAQQGLVNLRGNQNSGVQILSGDVGLVFIGCLTLLAGFLIYHYRTKAVKSEKAAQILAQQISMCSDENLEGLVYLSALNTDVESEIYHLMGKNQALPKKKS